MPEFRASGPHRPDEGLFSAEELRRLMRIEFQRAKRYGYDLACLCIAVDRLGNLQDIYGAESKSRIQELLQEIVRRTTRNGDFPRAFVGDALVALFPQTAAAGAAVLAQRLLKASRQLAIECDGRSVSISLSIGLSSNADPGVEDLETMEQQARAGMALAQASGGARWMRVEQAWGELKQLRRELDEVRGSIADQEREREGEAVRPGAGSAGGAPAAAAGAVGAGSDAELAAKERELETLRRRVTKLLAALSATEEELRRVTALQDVDPGVASIYRTVQGLSADASNANARLEMLAELFRLNLELRRRVDPPRSGR
ncbi:MAG TPA: diguanylate cyclase [Planctomycetota bacterium]|nr:diguanylate cyclase [Planctomycetota bacterium]